MLQYDYFYHLHQAHSIILPQDSMHTFSDLKYCFDYAYVSLGISHSKHIGSSSHLLVIYNKHWLSEFPVEDRQVLHVLQSQARNQENKAETPYTHFLAYTCIPDILSEVFLSQADSESLHSEWVLCEFTHP